MAGTREGGCPIPRVTCIAGQCQERGWLSLVYVTALLSVVAPADGTFGVLSRSGTPTVDGCLAWVACRLNTPLGSGNFDRVSLTG